MACELYPNKVVFFLITGVAVLISTKKVSGQKYYRDRSLHNNKVAHHQEEITILNVYEPNNGIKIHETETAKT